MDWLAAHGRGFAVGRRCVLRCPVPIVPAAILFDLGFPGRRTWTGDPPYRAVGRSGGRRRRRGFRARQCRGRAWRHEPDGLKGGIGSASLRARRRRRRSAPSSRSTAGARRCGPIADGSGRPTWRCPARSIRNRRRPSAALDPEDFSACVRLLAGANTTIAVVATDARARQERVPAPRDHGAGRTAARDPPGPHAVRRRHRLRAGDRQPARRPPPGMLTRLGNAAADCLARAIMRALIAAEPLGGLPSWRQLWGRAPSAA